MLKKQRNPNLGKVGKHFSKDYQPTPEQQQKGKLRKAHGKELAKLILENEFIGNIKVRNAIERYFGIRPGDINNEAMMILKQVRKAIDKDDTTAFVAVLNRAHGLPKQPLEHTGQDGKPIEQTVISNIDYSKLSNEDLKAILRARKPAGT
jgi:hypothetical protein